MSAPRREVPADYPAAGGGTTPPSTGPRSLVRPRGGSSRRRRVSRRGLAAALGAGVVAWMGLVFGTALSQVDAVQREALIVRAENDVLEAQLEAGRQEIAMIQTDRFLLIQSRAHGMGVAGERSFALEPGATSVEIVPLGSDPEPRAPDTPLHDWLELLLP